MASMIRAPSRSPCFNEAQIDKAGAAQASPKNNRTDTTLLQGRRARLQVFRRQVRLGRDHRRVRDTPKTVHGFIAWRVYRRVAQLTGALLSSVPSHVEIPKLRNVSRVVRQPGLPPQPRKWFIINVSHA